MFTLVFSSLVSENQALASRVLFRIYIDSEYITALYETCDYGNMKDDLLHDRLVVGIRNTKVLETL